MHLTDALDRPPRDGRALVRIRTAHAGDGWAVDDSTVWSHGGRLLALAGQARAVRAAQAAGSVNS
ncbi:hypothetical protein SZN_30517 [Streptomyces zinciresistens K42]|uniref:Acyl-CoA thioesterase-like C-terminal domain-containing protein n=1 Tax=Streptomyces zinciresistens K42 TaxID=700597 RepID=G2GKR0_9ACTN|nr:hypothetical protein [Streptomyces zinciresistens]EGX55909.1 hypothetical protein SZN_30517 [Streptomyces zinciresistens K42]